MVHDQLSSILAEIRSNCFDPLKDDLYKLPDSQGVYIICVRKLESLPEPMRLLNYTYIQGKPAIYTGIAGRPTSRRKSLRNRDFQQHFNGNARGSTLRKSLGVLLGLRKNQDDIARGNGKYRFEPSDESKLSIWMKNKLILHFAETPTPLEVEELLIARYNPPLNIWDNSNPINKEFREELSRLRRA
ncbi:GIY-YIG nuclease family protein [Desulfitobacterium hafniense]|uniref:GIY-YIG catalytic domain-containing protein n=1 Tax=Desulfitobacterium hafniense (strain Y51) TaxID=138119 RepID=Q24ZE9_DESHY|nr:hypothetical protein [Desulfitobacterium hafniense]BAE82593.1 hypothetical protein DSY0804 [Desulfitobacterium hafniense Y51]